nr:RHS repeat-associated core domain-containing protein [Vibrio sp. Isolate23]
MRYHLWLLGTPDAIKSSKLYRYQLDNHLSSAHLELNEHAEILSHEEYYPFGGTAVWSAKSQTEAKYKTIRYSGKERDTTGLSYYGYRYYAPWLCRWLNPDPAGTVDGLNLFITQTKILTQPHVIF